MDATDWISLERANDDLAVTDLWWLDRMCERRRSPVRTAETLLACASISSNPSKSHGISRDCSRPAIPIFIQHCSSIQEMTRS